MPLQVLKLRYESEARDASQGPSGTASNERDACQAGRRCPRVQHGTASDCLHVAHERLFVALVRPPLRQDALGVFWVNPRNWLERTIKRPAGPVASVLGIDPDRPAPNMRRW